MLHTAPDLPAASAHTSPESAADLAMLRAFVTLAREGRFTRAARALGVRQSTLTKQIQRLEQGFGTKLVNRSPNGAALTRAGQCLLTHARQTLASIEAARVEIGSLGV